MLQDGPQCESLCVLVQVVAESGDWVQLAKEGVQAAITIRVDSVQDVRVIRRRRGLLESLVFLLKGLSKEIMMG